MTEGIRSFVIHGKDLARAKALYGQLLGVTPYADAAYYVGFKVDGQDFGLDPNGHRRGMTGPTALFLVDDIKGSSQTLLDAGAAVQQAVRDVGGGRLIATVKDADGNVVGLLQDAR